MKELKIYCMYYTTADGDFSGTEYVAGATEVGAIKTFYRYCPEELAELIEAFDYGTVEELQNDESFYGVEILQADGTYVAINEM